MKGIEKALDIAEMKIKAGMELQLNKFEMLIIMDILRSAIETALQTRKNGSC